MKGAQTNFCFREAVMRMPSLKRLSVAELLSLRASVDKLLSGKRAELQEQLAELEGPSGGANGRVARRGLKGRKVAPKYRDPATGDTWAARGARPRWLVARLKQGKKLDDFLIDK